MTDLLPPAPPYRRLALILCAILLFLLAPAATQAAQFDLNAPAVELEQVQLCGHCQSPLSVTHLPPGASVQCPTCGMVQKRLASEQLYAKVFQICPRCAVRMDVSAYEPNSLIRCGACGQAQIVQPEAAPRNPARGPSTRRPAPPPMDWRVGPQSAPPQSTEPSPPATAPELEAPPEPPAPEPEYRPRLLRLAPARQPKRSANPVSPPELPEGDPAPSRNTSTDHLAPEAPVMPPEVAMAPASRATSSRRGRFRTPRVTAHPEPPELGDEIVIDDDPSASTTNNLPPAPVRGTSRYGNAIARSKPPAESPPLPAFSAGPEYGDTPAAAIDPQPGAPSATDAKSATQAPPTTVAPRRGRIHNPLQPPSPEELARTQVALADRRPTASALPVEKTDGDSPAPPERLDQAEHRVVAMVNDHPVTRTDLEVALAGAMEEVRRRLGPDVATPRGLRALREEKRRLRPRVLDDLIEKALILQAAETEGLAPTPKEVAALAEEWRAGNAGAVNTARLMDEARLELTLRKLRDRHGRVFGQVTPALVKAHYENNLNRYLQPARVRLVPLILFRDRTRRKDSRDATLLAREIRQRLTRGESFEALARTFSEYPDTGDGQPLQLGDADEIPLALLATPLRHALAGAEEGEVIGPFALVSVVAFCQIETLQRPTPLPLREVGTAIQKELEERARDDALREWIDKQRKDAYIKLY